MNVTGGGFQLGGGTESEARFQTPSYQVNDDLTMIRGTHQFGFGANVAFWTSLSQANVRSPGQFTFNGTITGLPLADFLTGSLRSSFRPRRTRSTCSSCISGSTRRTPGSCRRRRR